MAGKDHNFLGSSALITILRIVIKLLFTESILQYHKPGGPLAQPEGYFSFNDFQCVRVCDQNTDDVLPSKDCSHCPSW